MNWNKVDLDNSYEKDQNILDPLNFDTLLLEIECNLKEINRETVREQFKTDINNRFKSAAEIFEANLDSIIKKAQKDRNDD